MSPESTSGLSQSRWRQLWPQTHVLGPWSVPARLGQAMCYFTMSWGSSRASEGPGDTLREVWGRSVLLLPSQPCLWVLSCLLTHQLRRCRTKSLIKFYNSYKIEVSDNNKCVWRGEWGYPWVWIWDKSKTGAEQCYAWSYFQQVSEIMFIWNFSQI